MPAAPKSPPPSPRKPGAPKAKGAVRAKSGCYTCRIRRKKCDEQQNAEGHCETCVRLRLECLGFGAKRPPWLRNRNVSEVRDKIKAFLAAQGMIKGHSGAGPRGPEHDSPILRLGEDSSPSSSESPPTPTLSLSPSEPPRALQPHQSAIREDRSSWLVEYPHMHPHVRTASPFDHEGSSHSSHTDLYPAPYNPNHDSIAPWDVQPAQRRIAQTLPEFRPQFSSLFSPTYHRNYDDELYYQTPILEDVPGPSIQYLCGAKIRRPDGRRPGHLLSAAGHGPTISPRRQQLHSRYHLPLRNKSWAVEGRGASPRQPFISNDHPMAPRRSVPYRTKRPKITITRSSRC
ncbi:hypothetical protein B0H16DRAFT_972173 [Mycena metata]|uniref:Zn(2)-C6 fungal-type domain-containing protein n=1 Tax=Mycena metata TaxID=1033252 RepID=A0AAD7N4Z3_9AGAR|nr:hypothetical protein B0H16DRAFT_972173 [Mycena metata]